MPISNKLSVTDLDFEGIKSNLKTFLNAQDDFQDYDFEGSGLAVLIDMLAYNTHYMGFYANMLANEMFLDSSALRDSILSHARMLNVMPTSKRAAKAYLNFSFTPSGSPTSLIIDKNTRFTTSIDGINYLFTTSKTTTVLRSSTGTYIATDIEIVEGKLLQKSYGVSGADPLQRYIIPNGNIDTTTITVKVQKSASDTTVTTYTNGRNLDVNTIKGFDTVFFLEEIENGKYEILFGDDSVGKAVEDGNIIFVEYIVTNGPLANKASTFTATGAVAGITSENYILETSIAATGGVDAQTERSIKFQAPKLYSAQRRATTKEDYKAILLEQRPDIESITVYGGEDADPIQYGKVFIAVKPAGNNTFGTTTKNQIKNDILSKVNVVTIQPELIDPTFFYVLTESTVNYDPVRLLTDESTLKSSIDSSIQNYIQTNLEKFDQKFRYSQLVQDIDNTNSSIRNNKTKIKYQQRLAIETLDTPTTYTLNFNNALHYGTLTSSAFKATDGNTYTLCDDTTGNIKAVKLISGGTWHGEVHKMESGVLHTGELNLHLIEPDHDIHSTTSHDSKSELLDEFVTSDGSTNCGTIDYETGKVVLTSFRPVEITDGKEYIKVTVRPTQNNSDITPLREQILTYDVSDTESIVINMVAETNGHA